MGTVFTVFELDKIIPVKQEDCRFVETCFVNYEILSPKGKLEAVQLQCTDWGQYYIDANIFTEEVQQEIERLSANEKISMLVHRKDQSVMELSAQGKTIFAFADAAEAKAEEIPVMFYLGLCLYAFAFLGLWRLVRQLRQST